MRRRPGLFAGLVLCFDRNFPGHELITAILDAGGHVIARVKEGIALGFEDGPGRGWLPDGSRMTWLNAPSGKKEDRLPVRAAEHNVILPSGDGNQVSETCTVITTLLDHEEAPAGQVRDTYLTRWSAAETTFGGDKTTITGAGNRTSGPVLRSGSPRLVIQEAWAWLAGTQLVRASQAAALRSQHAAARALRRRSRKEVTADEESFTAGRRHAIRSMTSAQVTATSSLHALAAAADSAARAALRTLNAPDGSATRNGRRKPARNFRTPPRPRRPSPGNHRSPSSHPASASPAAGTSTVRKEKPPRHAGSRTVEPRATPAATRGHKPCPHPGGHRETDKKTDTEHELSNIPELHKHLKSLVLGPRTE